MINTIKYLDKLTGKSILVLAAFLLIVSSVCSIVAPTTAKAADLFMADCNNDFFESNNILFYNPCDNSDMCEVTIETRILGNRDYKGRSILSSAQKDAINDNKKFYESAGKKHDIPWQLIAAIHIRESGLLKSGPSNGYGPYQITPSEYSVGVYTDEEFQKATDDAALAIRNKVGDRKLTDPENIKYALFAYNGMAESYKKQAIFKGFSEKQANNGEGSPYVMNKYDLERDPSVDPTRTDKSWGQIKTDGGDIEYPANNNYGAYIYYLAITGLGSTDGCVIGEGGLNMDQAKKFMDIYKNSPDTESYIGKFDHLSGSPGSGCVGGRKANCTSFSAYFMAKYTSLTYGGGNGSDVVRNTLNRNPSGSTGTIPRPFSVFSVASGSTMCGNVKCGHTGVVLGVDIAKNQIIIGEAGCGMGLDWTDARVKPLDKWSDGSYTYFYTDGSITRDLNT
jgi:hypothetical protein